MSAFNVDHVAIEVTTLQSKFQDLSWMVVGLAYHEYQKQKHLLGDLSFRDWVDKLADEFHDSDDFPKDYEFGDSPKD